MFLPLKFSELLNPSPDILIYSPDQSERLFYILDFILGRVLRLSWAITDNKSDFLSHQGLKINYSDDVDLLPQMKPSGFLKECGIRAFQPDLKMHEIEKEVAFFYTGKDSFFGFDLFAMSFFMLTRYEEYHAAAKTDRLGRFSSQESCIHRMISPEKPLVDIWIWKFRSRIGEHFPQIKIERRAEFNFVSTLDIDRVWAFAHRGVINLLGGIAKDAMTFNLLSMKDRVYANFFPQKDPFFTFNYVSEIHEKYSLKPTYFILAARKRTALDENISLRHTAMKKCVKELSRHFEIGLHPSMRSHEDLSILQSEKSDLELLTAKKMISARYHYLKIDFPGSYRKLIAAGMLRDYSMGYHDHVGFRAGTAYVFQWFDLESNTITPLSVHPLTIMDMSLKKYHSADVTTAYETANRLVNQVKKTGGQFQLLWHNSSFYHANGWEGWKELYESILALSRSAL